MHDDRSTDLAVEICDRIRLKTERETKLLDIQCCWHFMCENTESGMMHTDAIHLARATGFYDLIFDVSIWTHGVRRAQRRTVYLYANHFVYARLI